MFNLFKPQCLQFKNGGQFWSPFFFIFLIIVFLSLINTVKADNEEPIQAWFKLIPEKNSLLVLPICKGITKALIRYEISANKTGPAGRSQNSQGGQLLLPAQQEIILSTLQFGLAPEDRYQFELRIFKNNILITMVTANYP